MACASRETSPLPSADDIQRAIDLYLRHAYGGVAGDHVASLLPADGFEPAEFLMSSKVERNPSDAPLEQVRSFTLRLGNAGYPHMKLRLSRPPRGDLLLFSVDSHDAFLHAPPGSPDHAALEELKKHNAAVAKKITEAWDAAGLLTEQNYLRRHIAEARRNREDPGGATGEPN